MKDRDEIIEFIIEEALLANRSAIWWQTEMNKCLVKLDSFEKNDHFEDFDIYGDATLLEERRSLEEKVEYLILKGQWEDKNLDRVMKQLELFGADEKRHIVSEISKRWEVMRKTLQK